MWKQLRGGGYCMKSHSIKRMIGLLSLAPCLLYLGCATPGEPTAKVTGTGGPSIQQVQMEQYDGPKARVAVGDFQVKAAHATREVTVERGLGGSGVVKPATAAQA